MMIDKYLDFYDDPTGEVLRGLIPSHDTLPDFIKTAERITEEEREKLPDDVFALVALDNGEKIRKFACVDKGNTALSAAYFLENGHKLPAEAQKTAAANLVTACGWYGLAPPEELEKVAGAKKLFQAAKRKVVAALAPKTPVRGGLVRSVEKTARSKNVVRQLRRVREKLRGRGDVDALRAHVISRVGALDKGRRAAKNVALVGSGGASPSVRRDAASAADKAIQRGMGDRRMSLFAQGKLSEISKRGSAEKTALVGAAMGALTMAQGVSQGNKDFKARQSAMKSGMPAGQAFKVKAGELSGSGVMPNGKDVAKMASMEPYVDITGKEAPRQVVREGGTRFALVKEGEAKYPIDTASQVQQAFTYFEKYAGRFEPHEKRMFCLRVNNRAQELGLASPGDIAKYGSSTMAKDAGVQIYRRQRLFREGTSERSLLQEMQEKCASIKPEVMAVALEKFDRENDLDRMWDKEISDPYASIFGVEKIAEWGFVDGNDTINEERLKRCAKECKENLEELFGDDMVEEFAKNPVQIFDSLPLDSKRIIMRVGQQVEE